ncbi:MAG: ribonuclease HI family protein [bacterium]
MKVKIFTDGGARGNPGPAAIGVVIKDEYDNNIIKYSKYLGDQTNNFAEYSAIISGLEKAKELGATHAQCFLDSELVVKQLTGKWKIKEPTLQKLFVLAYNAAAEIEKVSYSHIYREKNKEADALVNKELDKKTSE